MLQMLWSRPSHIREHVRATSEPRPNHVRSIFGSWGKKGLFLAISLENLNPGLQNSPQKLGPWLRSYVPHTKYKTRPNPKRDPEIHPKSPPPQNQNTEKIRKIYEIGWLLYIFRIFAVFQKNPRVRKIRVRNSGAGNGCANFMDTWKKCVLSAGKTMSVKFPFFGGGGECRFYFYGRADFSEYFGFGG